MARFKYLEADDGQVVLEAEPGEDIPVDMAQAWALIRIAHALELNLDAAGIIADAIEGARPHD